MVAAHYGTRRPGGDHQRRDSHSRGVARGRHHDEAQIVSRGPRLPGKSDPQVGVKAALVEFVEDDRVEVGAIKRQLDEPQ